MFTKAFGEKSLQLKNKLHKIVKENNKTEELTVEEEVARGIPAGWLHEYIRTELKEEASCLQLPYAIAFFVVFILAFLGHSKLYLVHSVQRTVERDIELNSNYAYNQPIPFVMPRAGHKNIYDISVPAYVFFF